MITRPPRSTLFPYTRSSDLARARAAHPCAARRLERARRRARRDVERRPRRARRSEEHTSELQSLTNIVCRLLLEKKKMNKTINQKTKALADGRKYGGKWTAA